MLEFEDMIYLDVQKTGSSYVAKFLRTFAATKVLRDDKHGRVKQRLDGKLYVISCRDPLAQYLSLYSYGCMKRGALRIQLVEDGKADVYDKSPAGFVQWLELIMTPEGGEKYLALKDNGPMLEIAGFQTIRFARMALPLEAKIRKSLNSRAAFDDKFRSLALMDVVLKQETLNEHLSALVEAHKDKFRDIDKVGKYLDETARVNVSAELDIDIRQLPARTLSYVQEREWLYFDILGYPKYV